MRLSSVCIFVENYPKGLNGTMEICFGVPHFSDVDREYERLVNAGAKPVYHPTTEPYGLRVCFIADPEGNLIEICSDGNGQRNNELEERSIAIH